ncbi:hypothetical protein RSAG8_08194, partial [Rhizoctonia solani AG-8 WAC10335]
MPDKNVANANPVPAVNEDFTEGGDLTLRSTDGIEFSVHSLFLSVASPVFSNLLRTDSKSEVIQFTEKAEVLALMLKFIYPKPTPIVPSVDLLNNGMRVANKYQLENMKNRLREQLILVDSPVSIYANPIGALCIASAHGFTGEAELAAKIASKQCGFGDGFFLKQLLDAAPSPATAVLIKLTGIPLVKTRVLMEVLFHFERPPMTVYSPGSGLADALVCSNCRETYRGYSRQSPPEWLARWAHWIFEEIKDRPIADWKGFFDHSNLVRAFYRPHLSLSVLAYKYGVESRICGCVTQILSLGSTAATAFQTWAMGIYDHLESRLSIVVQLEAPQIQEYVTKLTKE